MFSSFSVVSLIKLSVYCYITSSISGQLMSSCHYPPCRYAVYRVGQEVGNIVVTDSSTHVISWVWDVLGGRWNVTYHYNYPGGFYEGTAMFINCSNLLDGGAHPYVSWGSSKAWESNGLPIYAHAWNITYNGDVFGFVPTGNGRYIFRVYTRNKSHNPFQNAPIIVAPGSCHITSYDKTQVRAFWADRKRLRNCEVSSFDWCWSGNGGRWRALYKWAQNPNKVSCIVYYTGQSQYEQMIINWELDNARNSLTYKCNPIKIFNEPAWSINLNPQEYWGFSPAGQGSWILQHYSRNVILQPFTT